MLSVAVSVDFSVLCMYSVYVFVVGPVSDFSIVIPVFCSLQSSFRFYVVCWCFSVVCFMCSDFLLYVFSLCLLPVYFARSSVHVLVTVFGFLFLFSVFLYCLLFVSGSCCLLMLLVFCFLSVLCVLVPVFCFLSSVIYFLFSML